MSTRENIRLIARAPLLNEPLASLASSIDLILNDHECKILCII